MVADTHDKDEDPMDGHNGDATPTVATKDRPRLLRRSRLFFSKSDESEADNGGEEVKAYKDSTEGDDSESVVDRDDTPATDHCNNATPSPLPMQTGKVRAAIEELVQSVQDPSCKKVIQSVGVLLGEAFMGTVVMDNFLIAVSVHRIAIGTGHARGQPLARFREEH